ncbi:hypothetical protein [Candidatus Coxiella mudrowiae]|nr:hypothetical protein [Candidatus Coxiella mudrowiae]
MMIHPNTELKYINETIGHGVFVTQKNTSWHTHTSMDFSHLDREYSIDSI